MHMGELRVWMIQRWERQYNHHDLRKLNDKMMTFLELFPRDVTLQRKG
jgi:hypothetical protein